jgi:hypothetical protein
MVVRWAGGIVEAKMQSPLRPAPSKLFSPSEGEPRPPTLKRPEYHTKPPMERLETISQQALQAVKDFTVIREGVGKIQWEGETDVSGIDLDKIVDIQKKSIRVYDDASGVSRRAHSSSSDAEQVLICDFLLAVQASRGREAQ